MHLEHKTSSVVPASFGAMSCFAFAESLKRIHGIEPIHVFLSGASAPYVSKEQFALSNNTD